MEDFFDLINLVGSAIGCALDLVEDASNGKYEKPRTEKEKQEIREQQLSTLPKKDREAMLLSDKLDKKYRAIDQMEKETDSIRKRKMQDMIHHGYYNFDLIFGSNK